MPMERIELKDELERIYHTIIIMDLVGSLLPILSQIKVTQEIAPEAHSIHVFCLPRKINLFPTYYDKNGECLPEPIHHSEESKEINWERVALYITEAEDCEQYIVGIKEMLGEPLPSLPPFKFVSLKGNPYE